MLSIIIFIFGITIGSFLNVCICRIPDNKSIAYPPSHCTACGTRLKPIDLIPIMSYLMIGGKCRYCGDRISPQYPMVEISNGLLYIILFNQYGISRYFIIYAVLTSILIVIAVIDYKHYIIPDRLNGMIILLALINISINRHDITLLSCILGLLIGGGLFLLISIVSKGAMGGGDIKLMASLGLILGWQQILVVALLAFNIGAVISIVLILCKIKSRKETIPFGPFITISAVITLLYGTQIIGVISS